MAASRGSTPDAGAFAADFQRHGGRLAQAMRRWPHAPRPWIDLSTGISPFPYPAPRASRLDRQRLPDPERLQALEAAAANAFGVADGRRVVAVAGAETVLRALPALLGVGAVAIAEPTYGSHADAWSAAGARVLSWPDGEATARVVVLANPNNPDGRRVEPGALLQIADRLEGRGGWLVVDESFGEAAPGLTVAPAAHPVVVVLRSFGKMYGLAGLRLGFLIADPALVGRLRHVLGDWPVSADALTAGLAAYGDPAWLDRAHGRLERAAMRLDGALLAAGFEVLGGTALFRLTRSPDARSRFIRLAEQGVLARPFDDPALLRFGLPRPAERERVAAVLQASA